MDLMPRPKRPRLDVRDIVLVALLAAVGGVLSTYIGYLGNLINRFFGVPFGAGQLIAGLHILWPLLARSLTGRFGSGTLTGLTKGVVEFLSGGTHGIVIVLISLVQGLLADVGMGMSRRPSLLVSIVSGAVASASNVFLFQLFYFSGVSIWFVLFMAALSFVSGAFFGGYLSWDLHRVLVRSRIVRAPREEILRPRTLWRRHLVTMITVAGLLAGGVYYYLEVYNPFAEPDAARIEGAVSSPYVFKYGEWSNRATTITAELRGSSSYIPPQEYVGVPVPKIIEEASPKPSASKVRFIADDGYEAQFDLPELLQDDLAVLTLDEGRLRLIAGNYDGSYWIRRLIRIVIQ